MFLPRNNRQTSQRIKSYGNSEKRVAITILFFVMGLLGISFLTPSYIIAQDLHYKQDSLSQEKVPFRIVSWNIENLFDTHHDSLKNDREFLPDAMRHWNYSRYKKKLADIARVITAVGEWNPPVLVGLCEVENDTVLRDLTRRSPLKELGYRYVMTSSPDLRGIDVALLYQRDLFKLLSSRSISIPPFNQHRPTRDLLHVSGLLLTGDTLDVFVCHLPSRSGGAKESEPYRLHAAQILRTEADSILYKRLHPQVIIMGDFNDYPTNKSIQEVLEAEVPSPTLSPLKLYHLLARKAKSKDFGSYKYRGEWGLLDHLIVSGALLNQSGKFFTSEEKANVCLLPFLLIEDQKYGGREPFRTYKGMKYQGGISDHLPIYTDFELILY
ncbi:endonuclease/exonuclease/phosphatase family protein [uncultured Bacteroides sp.]|jgi:predicted extracellular nuclease|uniref:endonuclease/exonuclease/phosphatase family protein n=1 Tax=uncultured Bacteroides sp. TaxID=162156 RepID=UPI002586413B|nr:endonuclease/exonuclease/phosphatase family protein [uncultured Bacteroides sp.]